MVSSLLKTKLNIPQPRFNAVPRLHLIEILNVGLSRKLTLVSAPAGFGKTALLSEWAKRSRLPIAWLSLDENDNDLSCFWSYFVAAIQTIKPGTGETALASLQPSKPQPIEAFLITLINEISDKLSFAIVLDDYHLVGSRLITESIKFLLDHLPASMHLVISGRADPPLPLARLRARNQLTELRSADLRFTREETASFVNSVMKLDLSENEIEMLANRTEGWIASLQMAGIAMQGRDDTSSFVSEFSGSHRYILEYLADEVLKKQGEDCQAFLYQTSILKRMSGPLCDAITGRNDGQEMIAQLERNNLFVHPLDDEKKWYRYHQLFADVLRVQFNLLYADKKDILHSRASLWFEKEGFLDESIYHALQARDFERAAELVERIGASLIENSQVSTLLNLVSNLPHETVARRPWLNVCHAWALLLSGQPGKVEPALQTAEAGIKIVEELSVKDSRELVSRVRGHALTIRAYIARAMGNIKQSSELSYEAARLLPTQETTARSANTLNLAISLYMEGDVRSAARFFKEARTTAAAGNLYVSLEASCSLGDLEFEQGRLIQAIETYHRAIDLAKEAGNGHPVPAASHAFHGLGQIYFERNDLEEAARNAKQGIELSKSAHIPTAYRYASLALIEQALGDEKEARKSMDKAGSAVLAGTLDALHISAWKARLLLVQGDLAALQEWTTSQDILLNQPDIPPFVLEMPFLILCKAYIALGEAEKIEQFLNPLCQTAESQGRIRSMIEILIIQALVHQTKDRSSKAVEVLERALSLANGKGYIRSFIDQGRAMQQLLRQALQSSTSKTYIQQLLTAFPKIGRTSVVQPDTDFIEYLNEHEKQILRLMAEGLSNTAIAEKQYLSLNTVKWYIRQIYAKLGASGRVEAVNRARNLNIL